MLALVFVCLYAFYCAKSLGHLIKMWDILRNLRKLSEYCQKIGYEEGRIAAKIIKSTFDRDLREEHEYFLDTVRTKNLFTFLSVFIFIQKKILWSLVISLFFA